jgi:hypothetical protein
VSERGREWAQWASKLVLINSDVPSLAQVCTCDVLSLYWFALSEIQRSIFHASKLTFVDCPVVILQDDN